MQEEDADAAYRTSDGSKLHGMYNIMSFKLSHLLQLPPDDGEEPPDEPPDDEPSDEPPDEDPSEDDPPLEPPPSRAEPETGLPAVPCPGPAGTLPPWLDSLFALLLLLLLLLLMTVAGAVFPLA